MWKRLTPKEKIDSEYRCGCLDDCNAHGPSRNGRGLWLSALLKPGNIVMQDFPSASLRSRDQGRLDSIDARGPVCLSTKASGETLTPSSSVCTDRDVPWSAEL